MQDVETYRAYAQDCRRLAERAAASDRKVLLKIAEAWDKQAELAQRMDGQSKSR